MLRWRKVCSLLATVLCVTALAGGCFGRPETVDIGSKVSKTSGNGEADKTAEPEAMDPQTALIEGAKQLISTDMTALLTGGSDTSSSPLGILSDLIDSVNNRTHRANISLTLTDMVNDGEASDEEISVGLSSAYNIASGDAALEITLGMGTEETSSAGVYLTGNTALLKSASAAQNIILYEMAAGEVAGMTFTDRIAGIMGGILSDDAESSDLSKNQTDREELAARFLDPWFTQTQPEEYSESERTMTLLNEEAECRAVTLTMDGQRAYDFVLDFMTRLNEDEQFTDMNGMLGGWMGVLSEDIQSLVAGDEEQSEKMDTAAGQIVAELNALTAEEIEAAVFTVSVIYYGEEAVGIEIEASTTGKAFILSLLAYEKGLECQVSMNFQYIDGSTASLEFSRISAGGDAYDVNGQITIVNADGLQTCSGLFDGSVTEDDTDYALDGYYTLTIRVDNAGTTEQSVMDGDVALAFSHPQEGGYTGNGRITLRVAAPDASVSMTFNLTADIQFPDSVDITLPMYTQSNVTRVSDEQGLYEALGFSWEGMSQENAMTRFMQLIIAILMG